MESTVHIPAAPGRFVARDLAIDAAGCVFRLVERVRPAYADLADQARRAAASVPLNLSEGAGRTGKDRDYHFRVAFGSAREAAASVELLMAVGAVDPRSGAAALALLDRVQAITWRLCHPRP